LDLRDDVGNKQQVGPVIPFYERFPQKISRCKIAGQCRTEDVFEQWAGSWLLLACAQSSQGSPLASQKFSSSHQELLEYPGFWSLHRRSVAAWICGIGGRLEEMSFVFCLAFMIGVEWWKPKVRQELQTIVR